MHQTTNIILCLCVNDIVKNCNYHLQALTHILALVLIIDEVAKMMTCSIISSRNDYCNSLFYRMTDKNLNKLQRVQNKQSELFVVLEVSTYLLHSNFITCFGYPCTPGSSLNCQHCVFDHER